MPIYEYLCEECGHQFDTLQKMSDEPLKDCPACQAPALTKLVSAPSFRLSGSGWYETDFKSDQDKKKNLAGTGKETDTNQAESAAKKTAATDSDSKQDKGANKTDKTSKKPSSGSKTAA